MTSVAAAGGLSGAVTAILSWSAKTGDQIAGSAAKTRKALPYNILLAVAAIIFVATVLLLLGALVGTLLYDPRSWLPFSPRWDWALLPGSLVLAGAVTLPASYFININRFSQQGIYRNRLMRGFLGPTREKRNPDRFTGFDEDDNLPVGDLAASRNRSDGGHRALFHLLNLTLNVTATTDNAWQQRKAESFSVTPLHVGNPRRGYRPAKLYGGPGGITLATAMAISGAAVSPAEGYHSSTLTALLMTLLNVRLGSWLGNPRASAREWQKAGPSFALKPLLREAFGLTNDTSGIVYLSDGGHFENLGLYEMVRRRCASIVLCDAGCDPAFEFADLANAVRKIRIDMGIEIEFRPPGLAMTPRPDPDQPPPAYPPPAIYCAWAKIRYPESTQPGTLLYVKPCYYGSEPADIRGFAVAHPDFPHETTANQWFSESEFESYRRLGQHIAMVTDADIRSVL
jgi:hypothetical protein